MAVQRFSKLKLKFTDDLPIGSIISVDVADVNEPSKKFTISEEWVNVRTKANQVSLGSPTGIKGQNSAENFYRALTSDYNNGLLDFVLNIDSVDIYTTDGVFEFDEDTLTTPNGITPTLTPLSGDFIFVSPVVYSSSEISCSLIKASFTTSPQADEVISPVSINPVEDNPIEFELNRESSYNVRIRKGTAIVDIPISTPGKLLSTYFDVNIQNTPNSGAIVTVQGSIFGLELEYSIDNEDWQEENTFPNLLTGDYTVWVRDQYGCKTSLSFSVNSDGLYKAYSKVSKFNSIRYAQRVEWGNCGPYKTDENTLSCESDVDLPYKEIQQFQSCDEITTQFLSNFETNTAKTINTESGEEIELNVVKKSNHINLKDKRDAKIKFYSNGVAGIYFTSGNTYDFATGSQEGSYVLNGKLPEWGKKGNFIQINTVWYEILEVSFEESLDVDILIIQNVFQNLTDNQTIIAGCQYNLFNFEVYEFDIDMSNYLDENFQVQIDKVDSNFENITYLSEQINVKEFQKYTIEIKSSHRINTDMFFSTGIENLIRLPIKKINGIDIEESENLKTDTSTILISSDIYEGDEFEFEPVTKEILRKLILLASCSNVFMNGIQYVKLESFEFEGPLEDTNLYLPKLKMIKSTNENKENNVQFSGISEIIGLIDSGDLNLVEI